MSIIFDIWNIGILTAMLAISSLLIAILISPKYNDTNILLNMSKLRNVGIVTMLVFLTIIVLRVIYISG